MSSWFTVPMTVFVSVKVPDTGNVENDRKEAAEIARTLGSKRIKECTWGIGNPWTATVSSISVGEPGPFGFNDPDDDQDDDDDYHNEEDDDGT